MLLLIGLAACSGNSLSKASGNDPIVKRDFAKLLAATRPFQKIDAAVAAGYPRDVADCFVHEHHGAMGYHHVNRAFVDAKVDVEHPEILLYEKLPNGKYQLTAVEFIVPYRVWPADSVAPKVLGQTMLHENNLKIWSLHVWAWKQNANGLFADFNPSVQCPSDNQKVFTPAH